MESFTSKQREKIATGILGKYSKVAQKPEGLFKYPTGRAGLLHLNYSREVLDRIPSEVQDYFCGVGNPFLVAGIKEGDTILDVGCGAGVDTFIAALMTGPEGKVFGIDMSPDMLSRAETNLQQTKLQNVVFRESSGEKLTFGDEYFDVVISSGVVNLIQDKLTALKEIHRVMKRGARLAVADQVLVGSLPEEIDKRVDNWSG